LVSGEISGSLGVIFEDKLAFQKTAKFLGVESAIELKKYSMHRAKILLNN